jgi:hypothetical protein
MKVATCAAQEGKDRQPTSPLLYAVPSLPAFVPDPATVTLRYGRAGSIDPIPLAACPQYHRVVLAESQLLFRRCLAARAGRVLE